jgi:hypothetical protein
MKKLEKYHHEMEVEQMNKWKSTSFLSESLLSIMVIGALAVSLAAIVIQVWTIPIDTSFKFGLPIVVVFFLLALLVILLYQSKLRNDPIARKLESIENTLLKPANPQDALDKIVRIIENLKNTVIPGIQTPRKKWFFLKNQYDNTGLLTKLEAHLDSFNRTNNELRDFLTETDTNIAEEIKQLYIDSTTQLKRIGSTLNESDKATVLGPLYQAIELINTRYAEHIPDEYKDDEQSKTSTEITKKLPDKAGNFSDLSKQFTALMETVYRDNRQEATALKSKLRDVKKLFQQIEGRVTKLAGLEYNQDIKAGLKLDDLSVGFYRFRGDIERYVGRLKENSQVKGTARQKAVGEFTTGIERIGMIINLTRQDYQNYSRITAGLEALNNRYSSTLATQQSQIEQHRDELNRQFEHQSDFLTDLQNKLDDKVQLLEQKLDDSVDSAIKKILSKHDESFDNKNRDLEKSISKLGDKAGEAIVDIRKVTVRRVASLNEYYRKKNNAMDDIRERLITAVNNSISGLEEGLASIQRRQRQKTDEMDTLFYKGLKNHALNIIKGIKHELSELTNTLGKKIGNHSELLDDAIEDTENRLNGFIGILDQQLEHKKVQLNDVLRDMDNRLIDSVDKLDRQLEEKNRLLDQVFEQINRYAYDLVKAIKSQIGGFVNRRKRGFQQSSQLLREDLLNLETAFNSAMDTLKINFSFLLDQMSTDYRTRTDSIQIQTVSDIRASVTRLEKGFRTTMTGVQNIVGEKASEMVGTIREANTEQITLFNDDILDPLKQAVKKCKRHEDNGNLLPLVRYLNEKMFLKISTRNAFEVLKRIEGEPPFSEKYRQCGIALLKDILSLEASHKDKWYWRFLDTIKRNLEATIIHFYNREGKTIYDDYFKNDTRIQSLKDITENQLREVINHQHWGQIWEPLLRWNRFFNAYHQDEENSLLPTILNYNSINISRIMEAQLGYRIDGLQPMEQIPASYFESEDYEIMEEHFTFYREIIHKIKDNDKFRNVTGKGDDDNPLVIYIEQLGLTFNGRRISRSKLLLYSEANLRHLSHDI